MRLPALKQSVRADPVITNQFGGLNQSHAETDSEFFDMKNVSSRCFPAVASSGKRKVIKSLSGSSEFEFVHAPFYLEGDLTEKDFCGVISGKYYYNNSRITDVNGKNELLPPFNDSSNYPLLSDIKANPCFVFYNNEMKIFPDCNSYEPITGSVGSFLISKEFRADDFEFYSYYSDDSERFYASITYVGEGADKSKLGILGSTFPFNVGDSLKISYDTTKTTYNFLVYDVSDPLMREALYKHKDCDKLIVECVIRGIDTEVIDVSGMKRTIVNCVRLDLYNVKGELIGFDFGDCKCAEYSVSCYCDQSLIPKFEFTLTRVMPRFSYMCEANGRIFGLDTSGKTIRACKLYDPKSWYEFDGGADASWFAEVASNGEWTGIVNFGGYVYCFKKDICYVIFGDNSTNFSIAKTINHGCIDARSIQIIGNSLFFLSSDGFYQMSSSMPVLISEKLEKRYTSCVAGSVGHLYYASAHYDGGVELLCFDSLRGFWYKEDDFDAVCFFNHNNKLYGASKKELVCFGDGEFPEEWYVISRKFNDNTSHLRCLCELYFRLKIPSGADVSIFVSYDGGEFVRCGKVLNSKIITNDEGSVLKAEDFSKGRHISDEAYYQRVPVRLRACSSYQFKLVCHGDVLFESFERVLSVSGQLQR